MSKKKIYLAGGMEYTEDGRSWRKQSTYVLKKKGIDSWDPYKEEANLFPDKVSPARLIKTLDKKKDFDILHTMMRKIIHLDFDVIYKDMDGLMVKYDKSVLKGAGTHAEMSIATWANVPVHVWIHNIDLKEIPTWVIGCISTLAYNFEDTIDNVVRGVLWNSQQI